LDFRHIEAPFSIKPPGKVNKSRRRNEYDLKNKRPRRRLKNLIIVINDTQIRWLVNRAARVLIFSSRSDIIKPAVKTIGRKSAGAGHEYRFQS
jgi:hypothetical protein